ncbi:MAG: hypothetical protein HYV36_07315 [Lentisphaerae bacterium]|nr:hypothetical protein [Lentisphaerota bacterium]
MRIYEHRQTGDSFIITDPQLRLDQVKQVQTEVMALLAAPAVPAEEKTESSDEKTTDEHG